MRYILEAVVIVMAIAVTLIRAKRRYAANPASMKVYHVGPIGFTMALWFDVLVGVVAVSVTSDYWLVLGMWAFLNIVVITTVVLKSTKDIRRANRGR